MKKEINSPENVLSEDAKDTSGVEIHFEVTLAETLMGIPYNLSQEVAVKAAKAAYDSIANDHWYRIGSVLICTELPVATFDPKKRVLPS
jgi:hypothetical protein